MYEFVNAFICLSRADERATGGERAYFFGAWLDIRFHLAAKLTKQIRRRRQKDLPHHLHLHRGITTKRPTLIAAIKCTKI